MSVPVAQLILCHGFSTFHFLDTQCICHSCIIRDFFFENGNIMTSPMLTFFMDMFVTSVTQTSRNNIPGVIQCDEEEKSLCWNFSGYLRVQEESRKEESQEADDKVQTKLWNGTLSRNAVDSIGRFYDNPEWWMERESEQGVAEGDSQLYDPKADKQKGCKTLNSGAVT